MVCFPGVGGTTVKAFGPLLQSPVRGNRMWPTEIHARLSEGLTLHFAIT